MQPSKLSEHYVAGQINPDVETLLICNNIYCRSDKDELKGGEGGGYLALVAINTALKIKKQSGVRNKKHGYENNSNEMLKHEQNKTEN